MVQQIAIYCRVSTTDQSCERQERDLLEYAAKASYQVVGIWKETAAGTKQNRVERQKVLVMAQARKIDAILVTEMTRWGRSTIDLIQTLQELHAWGVSLIAQTGIQFDLNTSQGRLIANLMASLAEFERDLVRERVRSGIAAARARGQKLGRQAGQRVRADRLAPQVLQMVEQGSSYRTIAQALHLSKTTVNDIVKRHRQLHPNSQVKQPTMALRKQSTTQTIYQLKITLKDVRPPIWRRVQVASERTLGKLHQIIQEAMGWSNSHLHTFAIGEMEYGQPMPEYDFDVRDEQRVKLSQIITREKFKFLYTYDMGDSWEHEILVEKVLSADPQVRYPVCLTGKRACPPEDCGGVWGYAEFLEAIRQPDHSDHEAMLDWVGGEFDSEFFDLDAVNRLLRQVR
ncbi:IS1096 element passenger TnpR family protein [Phormidesmis sp. 146-12]